MKKLLIIVAAVAVVAQGFSREIVDMNEGWRFSFGYGTRGTTVDIPHTWDYDAVALRSGSSPTLANYMKDIDVPEAWRGKKVYIRFHGVNSEADLFINGRYAGGHKGGYTAFTVDLSGMLRYGARNDIWVRVGNAPQSDFIPVNGNFNRYGGIHRDVEIIVAEPVHILPDLGSDGVRLRQSSVNGEKAVVDAAVKLSAPATANYSLVVKVSDPATDSIVAEKRTRVKVERNTEAVVRVEIDAPHLWQGVHDPFLYDLTVEVAGDEKIYDSLTFPLGLRSFKVDPEKGFMLNGLPYPLRGVTSYGDRGGRGTAMRPEDHREDVAMMAEMGVTALRMTNYPHDRLMYELCDRYGIVVWSEIPLVGHEVSLDQGYFNKPPLRESGKTFLREMVAQRYNNTCVMFWGLFSNLDTRGDSPVEYVKELNALASELDPTRLTVAASNRDGDINLVTHLIGWSQYFGWKEGAVGDLNPWLSQLTRDWKDLRSAIGEYGAGGSVTERSSAAKQLTAGENDHSESRQSALHEEYYPIIEKYPSVWGSFVNSMFDFGSPFYQGGDTPGVCDFGLVTYDRRYKKDAFYYYKARWNTHQPFVYITERRRQNRASDVQTVKVYSNLGEVELFAGGVSAGMVKSGNGVFVWENVKLTEGENILEARSSGASDTIIINIDTKKRKL